VHHLSHALTSCCTGCGCRPDRGRPRQTSTDRSRPAAVDVPVQIGWWTHARGRSTCKMPSRTAVNISGSTIRSHCSAVHITARSGKAWPFLFLIFIFKKSNMSKTNASFDLPTRSVTEIPPRSISLSLLGRSPRTAPEEIHLPDPIPLDVCPG
jgi:hypothetical protein